MSARLWISFAALLVCTSGACGQQRLTAEIGDRVRKGVNRLTEDDVLKLVPGPFTIEMGETGDVDYVLTWEEVRRIRVVFSEGKVISVTASFSDAVASKSLSLANFKKITKGTALRDVETILGGADFTGDFSQRVSRDASGKSVFICEWTAGRIIRADIKGGKVSGSAFISAGE
jgi:hypothetical protein